MIEYFIDMALVPVGVKEHNEAVKLRLCSFFFFAFQVFFNCSSYNET